MAISIASVAAFWLGLRSAFQTEFPLLAVASGSMEPVFYTGDFNHSSRRTKLHRTPRHEDAQPPGEIIVYYDPRYGRAPSYLPVAGTDTHLIVHRAVRNISLKMEHGISLYKR